MERGKSIRKKGQEGQALITAVIFLLALTFLGFGMVTMSSIDIQTASNLRRAEQAFQAAEEGVLLGLAWAANSATRFAANSEGYYQDLNSIQHAGKSESGTSHFQVRVTIEGITEAPEGWGMGKGGSAEKQSFIEVKVQSVGMVKNTRGIFDFTKRPLIRRTIEVRAKVKKL